MTGWRTVQVPHVLRDYSPGLRAWQKDVHDGHLSVFAGVEPDDDGGNRFHLSISHRTNDLQPGRYPTWDEIKDARYRFAPMRITMALLLPPQQEYVNLHATTFHLWETPAPPAPRLLGQGV